MKDKEKFPKAVAFGFIGNKYFISKYNIINTIKLINLNNLFDILLYLLIPQ
jgi:hypothetical protein